MSTRKKTDEMIYCDRCRDDLWYSPHIRLTKEARYTTCDFCDRKRIVCNVVKNVENPALFLARNANKFIHVDSYGRVPEAKTDADGFIIRR